MKYQKTFQKKSNVELEALKFNRNAQGELSTVVAEFSNKSHTPALAHVQMDMGNFEADMSFAQERAVFVQSQSKVVQEFELEKPVYMKQYGLWVLNLRMLDDHLNAGDVQKDIDDLDEEVWEAIAEESVKNNNHDLGEQGA